MPGWYSGLMPFSDAGNSRNNRSEWQAREKQDRLASLILRRQSAPLLTEWERDYYEFFPLDNNRDPDVMLQRQGRPITNPGYLPQGHRFGLIAGLSYRTRYNKRKTELSGCDTCLNLSVQYRIIQTCQTG